MQKVAYIFLIFILDNFRNESSLRVEIMPFPSLRPWLGDQHTAGAGACWWNGAKTFRAELAGLVLAEQ